MTVKFKKINFKLKKFVKLILFKKFHYLTIIITYFNVYCAIYVVLIHVSRSLHSSMMLNINNFVL